MTLMAGRGIAQVLILFTAPLVTRLFTPEDFSTLEHYAMLLAVLGIFTTFRMEMGIVKTPSEVHAKALLRWCLRTSVVVSLVVLFLLIPSHGGITALFQNPELSPWLWLIPLNLVLIGWHQTYTYWHNRRKQFRISSISQLAFVASNEGAKLGFGWLGFAPGGLPVANVLARATSAWVLGRSGRAEREAITALPSDQKEALEIHRGFRRYVSWSALLAQVATWAHILLFSHFFGLWSIGLFALSRRLILAPLTILSQSFAQVFYQRISELPSGVELRRLFYRSLAMFAGLGTAVVVVGMLIPDHWYTWLLGDKWSELGVFVRLVLPWFGLNIITSGLSFINIRLDKEQYILLLNALHVLLVVGSILYSVQVGMTEWEALTLFVWAKVAYLALSILVMVYFVHSSKREPSS